MNLSSSIDYTLLQNKYLKLVVVLGFEILVALATKRNLVAVVCKGGLMQPMFRHQFIAFASAYLIYLS